MPISPNRAPNIAVLALALAVLAILLTISKCG